MKRFPLFIRADATRAMGTGHIMRMIALGQTYSDQGGEVVFVTACTMEGLLQRLRNESFQVVTLPGAWPEHRKDLDFTLAEARSRKARWMVLDGYHFDTEYQHACRHAGLQVLGVDDYAHLDRYDVDLLLNQNPGADQWPYRVTAAKRMLLGPRYAMLRREFTKAPPPSRAGGPVRRVLITLGGSDLHRVSFVAVSALGMLKRNDLVVDIVVGMANPYLEELSETCRGLPGTWNVLPAVDDMSALMRRADYAISAGGSTCWELCYLGVPFSVITMAANQEHLSAWLGQQGIAHAAGWYHTLDPDSMARDFKTLFEEEDRRGRYAQAGRELVDGQGCRRVLRALFPPEVSLRNAEAEDADRLLQWANDPVVRQFAFYPQTITWEEHLAWFERARSDPSTIILIGEHEGQPVGMLRFELEDSQATLSISLDPVCRGRGLGLPMLREGLRHLARCTQTLTVHAYVRTMNEASRDFFRVAGFHLHQDVEIREFPAYDFVTRRRSTQEPFPPRPGHRLNQEPSA